MKTEEIIERLRNPQKYNKQAVAQEKKEQAAQEVRTQKHTFLNMLAFGITAGVLVIAAIVWLVTLNAKNRAEDLSTALDPKAVQGLVSNTEFNPNQGVTYIQIYEGQDRNVAVDELGTTLPIINRFNYQAITPKNYGIIGMAPWALTENFAANLNDVDIIHYLLNRKEVAEAFTGRNDVAPLLEDPQLLAAFTQDTAKLNEFFESDVVKQVLANPALVRKIGGSRFMSYLLTSKAIKYYREHPQEAVKVINASPALSALRQNPGVRQTVSENYYLKGIASQLLGPATRAYAPSTSTPTKAPAKKKSKK
ncbi:MAG: hypothetical protein J6Q05_02620 [Elusimicrobiaceae bacterium]|nr:hypothetical protein [Elusimicrobiaceae bacterium]